jgi:hypothetical protein
MHSGITRAGLLCVQSTMLAAHQPHFRFRKYMPSEGLVMGSLGARIVHFCLRLHRASMDGRVLGLLRSSALPTCGIGLDTKLPINLRRF